MKKRLLSTLLTVLLLFCAAPAAYAADTVRVTLPDFSVTLNGQTLSNTYSKYPFLVYSGITYFPMTYYDCRLLGLRTTWTAADGLGIEKNDGTVSEYARQIQASRNQKNQSARIAGGKITVNGKTVNNSREQYPLLVFRDVTYFPLTWRFAVDEFGWDYHFDTENGLVISNPASQLTYDGAWEGSVEHYEAVMGVADTPLACLFYAPERGLYSPPGPDPYVSLYNRNGDPYNMNVGDVTVLPDDFPWEYQVYHVTSGGDELIYRKAIPFFSGNLPAWHFAHWEIDDTYDYSSAPKGTYRAVLTHPEYILYQNDPLSGSILSAPTEDVGYAVEYSREFTVR